MPAFKKNRLICIITEILLIERAGRRYRQKYFEFSFYRSLGRSIDRIYYIKYAYWIFPPLTQLKQKVLITFENTYYYCKKHSVVIEWSLFKMILTPSRVSLQTLMRISGMILQKIALLDMIICSWGDSASQLISIMSNQKAALYQN